MCQHGARAVRTAIFDGASGGKLRSFVVWLPILGGDGQTVALETGEVFRGVDVPQYWDGEQRVGKEIGRGLGVDGWVAVSFRVVVASQFRRATPWISRKRCRTQG
jgi:hypothetical protein